MKSKRTTLVLCLLSGFVGGHFIYLGKYHEAKVRFLWFFFCNPIAFIKSLIDFYKISRMNWYRFNTYIDGTVKGTGTKRELNNYLDNLKPPRNHFKETITEIRNIFRLSP